MLSSCRGVVSLDCDKVGMITKHGHNFLESFMVDGVESLSQVNEMHVKILVLFLIFVLNLRGNKDHVRGSSRCPETTMAFR